MCFPRRLKGDVLHPVASFDQLVEATSMRRPGYFVLFAIAVVGLVAGCRGDAPTVPALVAPTVRVTGDSVVGVAS